MPEQEYPEHQKLKAVKSRSQAIGEFLDWLSNEKDTVMASRHEHSEGCLDEDGRIRCGCGRGDYLPTRATIQSLLAEFFEIDEEKLETEKLAMLATLRREG